MNALGCTLDRKGLKAALGTFAKVIERRNTIPVLGCLQLTIETDTVKLTGTDLDLELSVELPAATEGTGTLLLPFATVKDAVGKLKGETVGIESLGIEKAALICPTTGARVILATKRTEDFPVMVRGDMAAEFWMPAEALAGAVAAVLPFTSTEETRYYLMGVFMHAVCVQPGQRTEEHEAAIARLDYLKALKLESDVAARTIAEHVASESALPCAIDPIELADDFADQLEAALNACDAFEAERCKPDVLRFVTTDGHRMARMTRPLPDGAASFPDLILPTKAAKLLTAIAKQSGHTESHVAASRTKVEFRVGRYVLRSKCIDGTFPDYTRVIPTQNEHRLTIAADVLAQHVETVAAVASEKTRGVAFSVSESDGLIVSCTSSENGRSAAIVEGAEVSEGAQLVTGFNAAYVGHFMDAFAGGTVTFQLSDAAGPVLIESPDVPDLLGVLMPMRVGDCVLTRADVAAMHMNPWAALVRLAENGGLAANYAGADATEDAFARASMRKTFYQRTIAPAIAFLVDQGQPRYIARLKVKLELASLTGDEAEATRLVKLIALHAALPSGSFAELLCRGRYPAPDPGAAIHAQDPAPAEAADPVAAADGPALSAAEPDKLETVAAVMAETVQPEPAQVTVVKVLTVTDQAVFVEQREWENPVQTYLQRYTRDGLPMGERVIHRDNLARLVPPRNRGDRPVQPKALPAATSDVADRLAAIEAVVARLAAPARPKRSASHVRAIMAYLKARAMRAAYASRVEDAERYERLWDREKVRVSDALAERDRLQVRCDALERLHGVSGELDAPPKPAIIMPAVPSRARVAANQ